MLIDHPNCSPISWTPYPYRDRPSPDLVFAVSFPCSYRFLIESTRCFSPLAPLASAPLGRQCIPSHLLYRWSKKRDGRTWDHQEHVSPPWHSSLPFPTLLLVIVTFGYPPTFISPPPLTCPPSTTTCSVFITLIFLPKEFQFVKTGNLPFISPSAFCPDLDFEDYRVHQSLGCLFFD